MPTEARGGRWIPGTGVTGSASCLAKVPGAELLSSGRAVCAHTYQTPSPAPQITFLFVCFVFAT